MPLCFVDSKNQNTERYNKARPRMAMIIYLVMARASFFNLNNDATIRKEKKEAVGDA